MLTRRYYVLNLEFISFFSTKTLFNGLVIGARP